MALYKADVYLGVNSGYQTVEIRSSSHGSVSGQICTIYHVKPHQIRNIREVRRSAAGGSASEGSDDIGGTMALLPLAFLAWLFATYTPYVMATLLGSGSAWSTTKLTAGSTQALSEPRHKRTLALVVTISLIAGGLGVAWGERIHRDHFQAEAKDLTGSIRRRSFMP